MTLRPFALLSACFALFLLASPARAEVSVLTSIKPLQLVAAAIQDGVGQPDVLLPPGASPHQYALRPSDVRRLREVQLFYWVGPDLENFLPKVLAGRQGASVAVQDLPGMHLRKFVNFEEEEHAGHDEHDHDHRPGMLDAHLWLLPANARTIAARMAEDLAQVDPANAGRYRANLKAFEERLGGLDGKLRERLGKLAGKPFFVFHEAFDYFEEAYGLRHTGVFAV
ncbi:TPA: zinc ABC transporter substrate-binding protein, partial [Pseudomonas aeruginosa]